MTDKNNCACPLQSSKFVAWLSLLSIAFLVFVALSNWQPLDLRLISTTWSVPLGLLIIVSLIAGFFAGISDYLSLNRGAKQQQIKGEWQAQDAKLAANLTSDREKQLEAKIATLEVALEKALKK